MPVELAGKKTSTPSDGPPIPTKKMNKKQKNSNIPSTDWKKMDENLFCHHKQCIFDQKVTKIAKIRIFPDTILPINDLKPLSPVSDQVTWNSDARFWRK